MKKVFATEYNKINLNNGNINNLFETAQYYSEKENCKIFIMFNGHTMVIVHTEYIEEFEDKGYWISTVFQKGYRCDI